MATTAPHSLSGYIYTAEVLTNISQVEYVTYLPSGTGLGVVVVEAPSTVDFSASSTLPPLVSTTSYIPPSSTLGASSASVAITSLTTQKPLSTSEPTSIVLPTTASLSSIPQSPGVISSTVTAAPASSSAAILSSHSISTGAAIGIGIGSAIAGALISAIIVCIFLTLRNRRKDKRHTEDHGQDTEFQSRNQPLQEKPSGTAIGLPVTKSNGLGSDTTGLPQPLDDHTLAGEFVAIGQLIRNHCGNFYKDDPVNPDIIAVNVDQKSQAEITKILPFTADALFESLGQPASRTAALRLLIASVVLHRLDLDSSTTETLLPSTLVACSQDLIRAQGQGTDITSLLSRWRVLTHTLLSPLYARGPFSIPYDTRLDSIAHAVRTLDSALRPVAIDAQNDTRLDNLASILKRAALFGFMLVGQPGDWDFEWTVAAAAQAQPGRLVVYPALVQRADDRGHRMQPSRMLSRPELELFG